VQPDGSGKPWKKNQVVPLPQPAPQAAPPPGDTPYRRVSVDKGEPKDADEPKRPSGDASPARAPLEAFAAQDTAPVVDQRAGAFEELTALCLEGAGCGEFSQLATRLQNFLNQQLPAALRSHSQPAHSKELEAAAFAAAACASGLLQPVVAHINRVLSNGHASTSLQESISWERVEFPDLLSILEDASSSTYSEGVTELGRPVALVTELLHQLAAHATAHDIPLQASALRVSHQYRAA
jgi:hypothetical protein